MNTKNSMHHLELALRNLPYDFALRSTRNYIVAAIRSIGDLETKREKREHRQEMLNTPVPMNPVQARAAVDKIDEFIERENEKIREIQSKKNGGPGDVLLT